MVILPRANPLYENIPALKVTLPEVLAKMASGGFTGYLSYTCMTAEAYALFAKGALVSALLVAGEQRKTGFEAISELFDLVSMQEGHFSVYRMTVDVAVSTHALLHGDPVLQTQEVRTVDLKTLLDRMKLQALNGTVLFCATGRNAMIFYKDGIPVGFYHDQAQEIESSPLESQKVAALPGATVEARSCPPVADLILQDLLEMVNIERLWETALKRTASRRQAQAANQPSAEANDDQTIRLQEIAEDLREIALAYLSRQGAALIDRLLEEGGGNTLLRDPARTATLLTNVAVEAAGIDPDARITEMVDLMQSEIAGRLSI